MKNEKAMLARPVPGLGGRLQQPLQAILRQPFQSISSIRYANDQHGPNIFRSAERLQQGRSRSERAVCFHNPVQARL